MGLVSGEGVAGKPPEWDFFLSYTRVDRPWAEWVAWQLEDAGYRVLIQAWDSVVGSNWQAQIQRGVIEAQRTVALLSAAYLTSVYGQQEWQAANAADPQGLARRLLPVRIEDCDRPGVLGSIVSIDLFDLFPDDARRRLLDEVGHALRGRAKPAATPDFPLPSPPAGPVARPAFPGPAAEPRGRVSSGPAPRTPVPTEPMRADGRPTTAGRAEAGEELNPFRPLRAFREDDARFFFGRQERAASLFDDAQRHPLVMVTGDSGAGKTSLVEAGLVPRLRAWHADRGEQLEVACFRPGDDPMGALASAMAVVTGEQGSHWPPDGRRWANVLYNEGLLSAATALLRVRGSARLLIVIDQSEELMSCSPQDREELLGLLDALAASERARSTGLLLVIMILRREYLGRLLQEHDALRRYFSISGTRRDLSPSVDVDLAAAVTGPAAAVGLDVEDGLAELISSDLKEFMPLSLLLLQLILADLWRRGSRGAITVADYLAAGGAVEVISRHADRIIGAFDSEQRSCARRILTRLGVPGHPDQRRHVYVGELRQDDQRFVRPLHESGLIAVSRACAGDEGPRVDIAHEALLFEWKRLQDWMDLDREKLKAIHLGAEGRRRWRRTGCGQTHLLSGRDLSVVERLLEVHAEESAFLHDYVEAGRLALPTAVRRGTRAAEEAQRLASDAPDLTRTPSRLPLALALGVMSMERCVTVPGDSLLRAAIGAAAKPERLIEAIWTVSFHPDGSRLAFGNHGDMVLVVDLDDGGRTVRLPHERFVRRVVFSPDGAWLATACDDGAVRLFELSRLWRPDEPLRPLTLWFKAIRPLLEGLPPKGIRPAGVSAVAFSPDGTRLAVGSNDGVVRLYRLPRGDVLGEQRHGGTVQTAAFSSDGELLATAGDDKVVMVLNGSDASLRTVLHHEGSVFSVAFAAGGHTLATGSADCAARVFDVPASGNASARWTRQHRKAVYAVSFSPDGEHLATGSGDHTVRLWDVGTGAETLQLDHGAVVWAVTFSPDGSLVATAGGDGTARVFGARDGRPSRVVAHTAEVRDVSFSGDGRRLATAGADGSSWVVDVAGSMSLEPGEPAASHDGCPVRSLAFTSDADGLRVASIAGDGRLWLVDPGGDRPPACVFRSSAGLAALACHPNGMEAVVADDDGVVHLVDLSGRAEPFVVARVGAVAAVTFADRGSRLVVLDGNGLLTFFDGLGRPLGEPWRLCSGVASFAAGHHGARGVVCGDHELVVFQGMGRRVLSRHPGGGVGVASMSLDGNCMVMVTQDGSVSVVDAADSTRVHLDRTPSMAANAAALDGNGGRLSYADPGGTARVVDLESGETEAELAHPAAVDVLAFSRDRRWFVTGGGDGGIRVWPLASELVRLARGRITRELTPDERLRYEPFGPHRTFTADAPWRGGR